MLLFRATAMMAISRAYCQSTNNTIGNLSCVSVVGALFDTSPCYQAAYAFTMNGNTSIEANTVNLAVVVDASRSITTTSSSDNFTRSEWSKEKEFAK
ncbi:unnamed protein product, partial [Ascophyllum nodosum]